MTIRQAAETADVDLMALVDLALAGEEVIFTLDGRDAAQLVPIPPLPETISGA